ncbi:hypothetical protein ACJMK2_035570 [Sinanodonta woodiana]|uniref:SWIM-type domain-containing protein n=1 Tax=Sinanodonta woodiana TaxID=1069815 RepID=A0ABD3WVC1_SINWO
MEFMFDWENEERFSFDDSDRFDEDSICSWISEPESLCNNWRGWKKQNGGQNSLLHSRGQGSVSSLVELASQAVACHIPFEVVEHFPQPIPEQLQLRIAFWSFPENEEDIRLYSCLANGSADEFQKGDHLYKAKAVKDVLQIGFHLSGTVVPPQSISQTKGSFSVAVMFDRRRISSCICTCSSTASWCSHVVALCLYRIHQAHDVCLRAPVSESLSRLHRDQLQKFAQYLISELPQQILPTAQRLLDELLSSQENAMNKFRGAPDPTAGPSASEQTSWCLDEATLHENVKKTLVKFCVPTPIVFSDVNYLSATAPPAAAEWQSLLRPLRGREPEGMWNLLSIVREMFRRNDSNAIPLLEIITDEVLQGEQILIWWFTTKVASNNNNILSNRNSSNTSANATQHAASSLCDEIVILWRLAALNPKLSPIQREDLCSKFKEWHISTVEKVRRARNSNNSGNGIKKNDIENFAGFKPGIEACYLSWNEYPIPGITYSDKQTLCLRYRFNRHNDIEAKKPSRIQPVTICSENLISTDDKTTLAQAANMFQEHHSSQDIKGKRHAHSSRLDANNDGAISSGSEGFCEPERGSSLFRDSDSGSEMKEINSRSNSLEDQDLSRYSSNALYSVENFKTKLNTSDPFSDHTFDVDSFMELDSQNKDGPGEKSLSLSVSAAAVEHSSESDEYQMYFFDSKSKQQETEKKKRDKNEEPNYFSGLKQLENKQEILFSRAEALHAHGHTREACKLAEQLAKEMLTCPPDLLSESANVPNVKSKKKKVLTNISLLASTTLSKAAFLCGVLQEESDSCHLAFQIGMFGLELPRPPAYCKALEVKLAYQESELLALLKKVPLGSTELSCLRERAEQLKDGTIKSRGDALLPLTLASFIFDSLCLTANQVSPCSGRSTGKSVQVSTRQQADEKLGFEGAVAALGMKANVSEAEHPLLCESTRRQRGELAITMLVHYKDDMNKLSKIMDNLLDKEVHQLYKAPSLVSYLSSCKSASHQLASTSTVGAQGHSNHPSHHTSPASPSKASELDEIAIDEPPLELRFRDQGETQGSATPTSNMQRNSAQSGVLSSTVGARPKITYSLRYNSGRDTDSSAVEEEGDDLRALEAKLRCMTMKKKPSQGMAAIDSSAPETTSSDNSPTLVRRIWSKHQGPGSDSGSSGDSDSLGSSSSGDKDLRSKIRDNESPPTSFTNRIMAAHLMLDSRNGSPNLKGLRFKGKTRIMPTVPNQPSEASAHFMFELAKTVLCKAGGNSSTSLFTQPSNSTAHTGPHRNLHLCAFQIGLYALGLNNCVSPNWLSRTYSSHVSWIAGQAMEIGSAAVNILIDTWEGHLTPPEVASLADRASRGRDPNMVRAAAELALSCLPHAQALNPSEVQRALFQCKEQSREMSEKACLAVESAAKGGGVYPEVLFHVARRWYELAEEVAQSPNNQDNEHSSRNSGRENRNSSPATVSVSAVSNAMATERTSPVSVSVSVIPFSTTSPHTCTQVTVSSPQLLQHPGNGQIPTQTLVLPYALPQTSPHPQLPHPPAYVQPAYNIVQQIQPFVASYPQQPMAMQSHTIHPYVTTFTYQNPQFSNLAIHNPSMFSASAAHFRALAPAQAVQVFPSQSCQVTNIHGMHTAQAGSQLHLQHVQAEHQHHQHAEGVNHGAMVLSGGHQHAPNQAQANYLQAAFRVGMLAMETLARRVHDDRPQTKYARNPPYGEDVKWLLGIGIRLGTSYLQQFTASAVNAVVSPFVLYDIALEAAHILARNNPAVAQNHLRSNILNPLVQKCLQMFIQCAHQRIHHISQPEYDDFVSTICSARNAFYLTPGGMVQFQELLQSLRRSKSCRKDLWQRLMNGLSAPGSS